MEKLKLNETPVRTSRNFKINNIILENINIPENIDNFENVMINTNNIIIDKPDKYNLRYGLSDELSKQVYEKANKQIKLLIDKDESEIEIFYNFDNNNLNLVDHIQIESEENKNSTIIIKYKSEKDIECYHNGIIDVLAKKNSRLHIIIINFMNEKSNNFMTVENMFEENAEIKYTIIDCGGKNSITNYYSNINADFAKNNINAIYLGDNHQLFDLNYITELSGKQSEIDIEVQGALKGNAKKRFKGTIDFKKGAKKASGNENESCMLLSNYAISTSLPMLLCAEEDVEGNHSCSSGKIGDKELFYIMSRGFSLNEAIKLIVTTKFNKILENIENEEIRNEINYEINKKLDE